MRRTCANAGSFGAALTIPLAVVSAVLAGGNCKAKWDGNDSGVGGVGVNRTRRFMKRHDSSVAWTVCPSNWTVQVCLELRECASVAMCTLLLRPCESVWWGQWISLVFCTSESLVVLYKHPLTVWNSVARHKEHQRTTSHVFLMWPFWILDFGSVRPLYGHCTATVRPLYGMLAPVQRKPPRLEPDTNRTTNGRFSSPGSPWDRSDVDTLTVMSQWCHSDVTVMSHNGLSSDADWLCQAMPFGASLV